MDVDVAIVGGGIAGLSCAAVLAQRMSVVVLEAEPTLGYHTTGRSAAIYTECYGAEPIRRITRASKAYFTNGAPPHGVPLQVLFVAPPGDGEVLDKMLSEFSQLVDDVQLLTPDQVTTLVPAILSNRTAGGLLEPNGMSLDVDAILTSYARAVRTHNGTILTGARVSEASRHGSRWRIRAGDTNIEAAILVNAAGAWGDRVAQLAGVEPIGLTPLKRSAFTFDPGVVTQNWPMVIDTDEKWYMKPEGPHLLGSAASEIPEDAGNARPDELDIALGIERITTATDLSIRAVKSQWAGLRTFSPDRIPVVGFDPGATGFFWLVGQGGYGIHTSPGLGALSAGLIVDRSVPDELANHGITVEMFSPERFLQGR